MPGPPKRADVLAEQARITKFCENLLDCWTDGSSTPHDAHHYQFFSGLVQTEIDLVNESIASRFAGKPELIRAVLASICAVIARQLAQDVAAG